MSASSQSSSPPNEDHVSPQLIKNASLLSPFSTSDFSRISTLLRAAFTCKSTNSCQKTYHLYLSLQFCKQIFFFHLKERFHNFYSQILQFLGWIKSPNVLLVKSYFLVVGLSMHHHQSQLPLTRVIAIETLLIVFSSRHLFTIMVPVPWVTMWSTMSCHTLPSRQGNITWPSPQSTPTNPHISSWLLDESFAIAAAYHDGITVTLTTSRLFRLAKVTRWLTLAFSDIGHVSQVWSHSVMCWELKNGVKDVTSDNFPSAIAFSFFTFKVKSLRAFNPCVMIQYQNRWG